ncbi:MAG: hypothetical protein MJ168_05920 [Clostridia bacterium]|nr:hypothetical protein [Clostridia bacterium]
MKENVLTIEGTNGITPSVFCFAKSSSLGEGAFDEGKLLEPLSKLWNNKSYQY